MSTALNSHAALALLRSGGGGGGALVVDKENQPSSQARSKSRPVLGKASSRPQRHIKALGRSFVRRASVASLGGGEPSDARKPI